MNEINELKILLQQIKSEGINLSFWAYVLLGLISTIGAFIAAYLKKRGENYATKQDSEEILERIKDTTEATKLIEGKISKDVWEDQKRWDLKQEIYSNILNCLYESKEAIQKLFDEEKEQERVKHPNYSGFHVELSKEEMEKLRNDLLNRHSKASEKVHNIIGVSSLFLDKKTIEALQNYEKYQKYDTDVWEEYLEMLLSCTKNAYDKVLKSAKDDMKI